MRIAFIVTEFVTELNFSGGLANYTERMALSLVMLGHTVEVFVLSDQSETIIHKGIPVHRVLPKLSLPLKLLQLFQRYIFKRLLLGLTENIAAIIELKRSLHKRQRQQRFDIVQYTHLLGVGSTRSANTASIVRLSSYAELLIPYGFDERFSTPFRRWIENLAIKRADAVVSPSSIVGDYVGSRFGIPVHIIESPFVPPNTVTEDPSVYKDLWQNKPDAPATYGLYFGSLAEWKGIWVLTEALDAFLRQYPNTGFIFIGKSLSNKNGQPASEWITQQLSHFSNRVLISPPLRHPQLYPFIRNADFVALPSLMDNLPNTMLESMWMKKVVIGTRGRSFDELIEHNRNGLLCEPEDTKSLLATMSKASSLHNDDKNRIGELAHKRIQQLYPDIISRRFEAMYQEVLHLKCI